ncbi:MAG: carboxymuconolactone decarboxylase family protein [Gemmatimonadota bacterium]|nr:carboxymuconolactone decarboxylase family protein [Gemmatimonadota bacterium]
MTFTHPIPRAATSAGQPPMADLDRATASLVRLAARVTGGIEEDVRAGLVECLESGVPATWLDELVLQSYLFAGFPRALNAARELRRVAEGGPSTGGALPDFADSYANTFEWRLRGQDTCSDVYGPMYEKLRANIRQLHPALDEWMIVEGYGKVLSRPGLDLRRRELCIVAACVAAGQDRQLHSHLHGARNVGVADTVVSEALAALEQVVPPAHLNTAKLLWARVLGK